MSVPVWFHVRQRALGFKEFLDRYHDRNGDESYTAPLFALLILQEEPYVNSDHVLRKLNIDPQSLTVRDLAYHFVYWALSGHLGSDLVDSNNPVSRMRAFRFSLPPDFSTTVQRTVEALIWKFFGIEKLSASGKFDTIVVLAFVNKFQNENFRYSFITMSEVVRLYELYLILQEIREWLLSGKFPSWIARVPTDWVAQNNRPTHWKNLPVDLDKLLSHLKTSTNFDYIELLVEELEKIFPDRIEDIRELTKPSPTIDAGKARKHLESLSPLQRMKWFPITVPMIDSQVESFLGKVVQNGFETTFRDLLLLSKQRIQENYSLACETTIHGFENIYLYPIGELIWIEQSGVVYAFAKEDLQGQKINPYNREPLPSWVDTSSRSQSESYPEMWSKVLNRKVVLEL
jgi:hypothetical protein